MYAFCAPMGLSKGRPLCVLFNSYILVMYYLVTSTTL